jgi:hypothetical protein
VIGEIMPAADGLMAYVSGQPVTFPSFTADEITQLFS